MTEEEHDDAFQIDRNYRQLYRQMWLAFIAIWVVLIFLMILGVSVTLALVVGIAQSVAFYVVHNRLIHEHNRLLAGFIDEEGHLRFHEDTEPLPWFEEPILNRRQLIGTGIVFLMVIIAVIVKG
jgi:hypothetical protein